MTQFKHEIKYHVK